MKDYCNAVESELPEDLQLTIYEMDISILTRLPLSEEDLIDLSENSSEHKVVTKTVVTADELAEHHELLQKLKPSALKPAADKDYMNARIYYVFETESGGKLLEVTISDISSNVFVNGIEVMANPIFFLLIEPFVEIQAND